jgi:hypothetical protein
MPMEQPAESDEEFASDYHAGYLANHTTTVMEICSWAVSPRRAALELCPIG